jgi:hypothetical protein
MVIIIIVVDGYKRLRLTTGIVIPDGEKDGHFYGRWL